MSDANTESYGRQLAEAIESYDRAGVKGACDELVEHLYSSDELFPETEGRKVVGYLRRSQLFDAAERIADALVLSGSDSPSVRRLHAMTLLDLGRLGAALVYLDDLDRVTGGEDHENREARGLTGRVFKQLYLLLNPQTQRAENALNKAIECYWSIAEEDPTSNWFTINVVALLCRAARHRVPVARGANPREIAQEMARQLLTRIEQMVSHESANFWDYATA